MEDSVSNIAGKEVEYSYDSARLLGYFCAGTSSASTPGVILAHDAFGVGDYMKQKAKDIAALGYAVLAADVWGDGKQLRDEAKLVRLSADLLKIEGLGWAGFKRLRGLLSRNPV